MMITVLEIGEDVWGLSEYFHNDIDELIEAFTTAQREIAPDMELRLQIGLSSAGFRPVQNGYAGQIWETP